MNKKKMKIIFFFLLIQIVRSSEIVSPANHCYAKEKCRGEYFFSCTDSICSKDKSNCKSLRLWYSIIYKHPTVEKSLIKFLSLINECPKWDPKSVCLNNAVCYYHLQIPFRLTNSANIVVRKKTKCECKGKYGFTCDKGKAYCSVDKEACDQFNITVSGIISCRK